MKGKLIVFEGTDGAGKATQTGLMAQRLEAEGVSFRKVNFPRYGSPFAAPVERYLQGQLGTRPGDVSAYAASTLYAIDRYASYKEEWSGFYQSGGVILADRYTTSNAVHQAAKLGPEERDEYLRWLFDLEYHRLELPEPDLVIYLDLPTEISAQLLRRPTSMSRMRTTSVNAGRMPAKSSGSWAGGGSTVPGTARCARRRISMTKSGRLSGS